MSTSTQPRTSSGHARHNSSSGGSSSGGSFAAPVPPSPSSVTAGFSPGGQVPSGYSYLHRSHSLLTPTRRNVPSGLGKGEKEAMGSVKVSNSSNNSNSTSVTKPDVAAETPPWQSAPPPAPPQRLQRSLTTSSSSSSSIVSLSSPEPEMRKLSEQETVAALVAKLPANPKAWTPSQVALYLTHVLGLTPRPIVEDVTAYVRRAHMGGRVFLRLKASDLEEEGLNTKWRRLMIEAVKKLRRDCLRGRIWGHEGGMQWPRQDDVEEQDEAENEADGKALDDSKKTGPAYAKGTLKRLRDKKQVRGMIRSFESAADLAQDEGAASTPRSPIIVRRESVDSLASSQATSSSPREPMAPIYGEGYVKQRAESFTSLSEMSGDEASRKKRHFEMAKLEHWFGSLSEQEAASLVSELEDDDLNFDEDDEHRDMVKAEHEHQRSSSSHSGTGTGESAPGTPPPHSPLGFTPLDASLVQSIIGGADPSEAGGEGTVTKKHDDDRATFGLGLGLAMVPPPRRMDVELDDETEAEAAARRNAHLRPGRSNGGKSNPYRSSTYDVEEREALGIGADDDDDIKYGTARKIVAKPDDDDSGLLADNEMDVPAAKGIVRVRNPAPGREDSRSLFASDATRASVVPQAEAKAESSQPSHMSHMSAHVASGVAPYKPLSPGVSRRTSVKRQEEAAAAAEESYDAIPPSSLASMANEMSKAGTFGRKAGSRRSGQLKQLVALHSTTHEDDGKTHASVAAEDEGKWGGTLSRKNSRRGNPVALQLQESLTPPAAASSSSTSSSSQPPPPPPQRDNLRQRMMDLFSPIDDEKPAEAAKDDCGAELSAENLQALDELLKQGQEEKAQEHLPAEGQATEGDGNVEMLSVPLTTLAPSPDGKGSIKKTSMVLVERKRFESLARRMGVLEDQLSQLDALTETGSALGVGSFASSSAGEKSHARRRTALEEVFTIPQHAGQVSKDEERETKPSATHEDESDEEDVQSWGFNFGRPLKLGAIPSYALGLAAGAGFVLLSEVLGRGRH